MSEATLYTGDSLTVLKTLPDESVQTCVTSPPYWGLRDYGCPGQLGLERTPEDYVENMVAVFREVRRVLRDDGTLWLNMGDSYAGSRSGNSMRPKGGNQRPGKPGFQPLDARYAPRSGATGFGCKAKDLVGMPWRLAFALQADGWWLRSDIIWSKPNPMPESVRDRPTKSHEYVFLLAKSERYYYDAAAIAEALAEASVQRINQASFDKQQGGPKDYGPGSNRSARRALVNLKGRQMPPQIEDDPNRWTAVGARGTRNARTVWEIATKPYREAHFATFPEELARRCILAGSRPGDTVLDPFGGSGTVAQVATGNGRDSIYIDLNPKYGDLARRRIGPILCRDAA